MKKSLPAYFYQGLVLIILFLSGTTLEHNFINQTNALNITMYEGEELMYEFRCSSFNLNSSHSHLNEEFNVTSDNIEIAGFVSSNNSQALHQNNYKCTNGTAIIHIQSGHLGLTNLVFCITSKLENPEHLVYEYAVLSVSVLRKITLFDKIAVFILTPLVLINKCAFGAKIEIEVLKQILRKPVELLLCLTIQFVVMPLIGISLGYICDLSQVMALALLVSSSCPGGGGGYVFSFLINGDITLAITASLMSTLVAIIAMPAVIGTYVAAFGIPNQVNIPYQDIVLILVAISIPISTGMMIKNKRPDFASKLIKVIRPLSWIIIMGGLTIFIVTSRYVLYGPKIGILVAFLLPFTTFVIAIMFARCLSFEWPMAKAVSLESGLKNTVLGIAVIELSFPQPQADLASILIIMITIGHTLTAIMWYFLYLISSKCFRKSQRMKECNKTSGDVEETEFFLTADSDANAE